MRIGGFLKHSLIDYPSLVSCVVFATGCNFSCPFCHNPDLVGDSPAPPSLWQEDHLEAFLRQRRGLIDGVVISGGEPTLQPDLAAFCEKLKQLGFAVKLDTNGSRPQVIRNLLENKLVDYLAMDIKTDPRAYTPHLVENQPPDDLLKSIDIIMAAAPAYEFRTTCVKPFVNTNVLRIILNHIKGARRYCLQRFKPKKILRPDFFDRLSTENNDDFLEELRKIAFRQVEECIVR